jgi:hypothetical protein
MTTAIMIVVGICAGGAMGLGGILLLDKYMPGWWE